MVPPKEPLFLLTQHIRPRSSALDLARGRSTARLVRNDPQSFKWRASLAFVVRAFGEVLDTHDCDRSMDANRDFPNTRANRGIAVNWRLAKPAGSTAVATISSASVPGNEPHPRLYSRDLMRAIRMHRIPQSQ